MATFPSIDEPSGLDEEYVKAQVRTEFEDGTVKSRPRHSRSRYKWTLSWEALPTADKATLETFFDANQGDTFTWTHPLTSTSYTARFSADSVRFSYLPKLPDHWEVQLAIEEA